MAARRRFRRDTAEIWAVDLGRSPPSPGAPPTSCQMAWSLRARTMPSRRLRPCGAEALKRLILSSYLGRPPQDVGIRYGEFGKPLLHPEDDLSFSVSYSGQVMVIGVARDAIGIDIELWDPTVAWRPLARACLNPRELDQLETLPAWIRSQAVYEAWVLKEAILKCLGTGLSRPLSSVTVSIGAHGERSGALDVHASDWEPTRVTAFSPCLPHLERGAQGGRGKLLCSVVTSATEVRTYPVTPELLATLRGNCRDRR